MDEDLGKLAGRAHSDEELLQHNQAKLTELRNFLQLSGNEFSLAIAACNYSRLRTLINQELVQAGLAVVIRLPRQFMSLRETMHQQLAGTTPPAVLVVGLDYLSEVELKQVLQGANRVRDGFRQELPLPVVLWMNQRVQQQFAQHATDFRSFAPSAIQFTLPPAELWYSLKAGTQQFFINILERGGDRELTSTSIRLHASDALRSELEFAVQDLMAHNLVPDPSLQASLDFLQGRQAHSRLEMTEARELYERSLTFWQGQADATAVTDADADVETLTVADKQAVLWLHLGLWWRSNAVVQRVLYDQSLRQARQYFEQLLEHFRDREQTIHLARFIHALAEVLQKQRDWESLATLANEGIRLHQETDDAIRLARDHGFLAEVALIKEDWLTAQDEADQALAILERAQTSLAANPEDIELANALEIAQSFQRGWYRFLKGEAQMHLAEPETAIAYLEAARWETDPEVDLTLHLTVLNELIHHYFELGRYLEAFDVKQERRRVEYRYNLRAFIGAGAVQPHQRPTPKQPDSITQAAVAAEIRASGRLLDVDALTHRLASNQTSILIIHGPSGVGKSSILTAGLIPRLRTLYPNGRTTQPILVQTYGNWPSAIAQALTDSVRANDHSPLPPPIRANDHSPLPPDLIQQLRSGTRQNRFYVLVFDQFEEFFFDRDDPEDRRQFYEFLQQCMDLPNIKVVLSLREDYLHHLLEAERIINRVSPDWDLLSKDVRYALANFSPAAAEAVIRQLTSAAQYPLPDDLIHRLVTDLAAETGDVRPIELQVVGAQLQREDIHTL
ncbi:MAG: AAA family ATPase, partial [Cyanobacteria bacterium P01_D01_bin.115]